MTLWTLKQIPKYCLRGPFEPSPRGAEFLSCGGLGSAEHLPNKASTGCQLASSTPHRDSCLDGT